MDVSRAGSSLLLLAAIGCKSDPLPATSTPDARPESSWDGGSSYSCGSGVEGNKCARPGELIEACECLNGEGIILVCCNASGVVRSQGCQDKWVRPKCFGSETGPDLPPLENGTTGKECTDDATCDPQALGTSFCSPSPTGFFSGSLFPTPVCFSVDCDAGDGTSVMSCDKDTGVCLPTSSGGLCLPACSFDDTGAPPKGCIGKNKCSAYRWSKGIPAVTGVGYCFGGCTADVDCPLGNKCQRETGLCVKSVVAFSKSPGDPCVKADAGSSTVAGKCSCLYTTAEGTGFCTNVCYVGETSCGAGFTCDPELPNKKLRDTDTIFTKAPTGLAGYCLKNCATDADCAGLNAYCDDSAGVTQKTCHLGKRPCVTNEHCPAGQTCSGATASTTGRCG